VRWEWEGLTKLASLFFFWTEANFFYVAFPESGYLKQWEFRNLAVSAIICRIQFCYAHWPGKSTHKA